MEGKQKKNRATTAVIIILSVLTVLVLLVVLIFAKVSGVVDNDVPIVEGGGWSSDKYATDPELEPADGEISENEDDYYVEVSDDEYAQTPIYKKIPIDENVINILIVGQDATLASGARARSDSSMIVSYNREKKTLRLVSILRDTWVQIEGHNWNRINAAYAFGGIGLLTNTLNDTYDLDLQDYVVIGFNEFERVIDELGGITMSISSREAAYINRELGRSELTVKAQTVHMDGQMALIFARCRRVGGVFERDRRQREVMLTIYEMLREKHDAKSVSAFITFALNNVRTNIQVDRIFTLAMELLDERELKILPACVPFEGGWRYARIRGKAVISINLPYNIEKLHEFLYPENER